MKQNKQNLAILLICVAIGCLMIAGVLTYKHLLEDRQSEADLNNCGRSR